MGDAVTTDDRLRRLRRTLVVAAGVLALQLAATVYGYLPLAKFRFRNISGSVPAGIYVANEWFAWQVVDWNPARVAMTPSRRIAFPGFLAADVPGICRFVRVSVLWTIVPNLAWLIAVGRYYRLAMHVKRAGDPAFDRGFTVEPPMPIACGATGGQRLAEATKSLRSDVKGVASRGTLP